MISDRRRWRLDGGVLDSADRRPVDMLRAEAVRGSRPMAGPRGGDNARGQVTPGADRRIGENHRNHVGVLGLDTGEVGGAVEAEESGDLGVGERRKERDPPTECRGGDARRAERVARIVLTITVGARAIPGRLAKAEHLPRHKGSGLTSAEGRETIPLGGAVRDQDTGLKSHTSAGINLIVRSFKFTVKK